MCDPSKSGIKGNSINNFCIELDSFNNLNTIAYVINRPYSHKFDLILNPDLFI